MRSEADSEEAEAGGQDDTEDPQRRRMGQASGRKGLAWRDATGESPGICLTRDRTSWRITKEDATFRKHIGWNYKDLSLSLIWDDS